MIRKITLLVGALYALWSLLWRVNVSSGPVFFLSGLAKVFSLRGEVERDDLSRIQIGRIIDKYLALHSLNRTPRRGVSDNRWVRGITAETVQGHVGACMMMAEDYGVKVFNWPRWKVRWLVRMMAYHELDELFEGDVSIWSTKQKRDPNWTPMTRAQWYASRQRKYFERVNPERLSGREIVIQVLEEFFDPSEREEILALNDEFVRAETDVAKMGNQLDDLQSVVEAGARYQSVLLEPNGPIHAARRNFLSFYRQGVEIMEYSDMVLSMELLWERVARAELVVLT